MTENKTSQAVDAWLSNLIDGIEYDEENGFEDEELSRRSLAEFRAIREKYKRMEKALQVGVSPFSGHCLYCGGEDCKPGCPRGHALSFDLLSTPAR